MPHATFVLLVVTGDGVYVLDMAAKIDATAEYICKAKWGDVEFPPPFGREAYAEVRSVCSWVLNSDQAANEAEGATYSFGLDNK